eukprot:jgi/Psemu1/57747/gm1.57747_g
MATPPEAYNWSNVYGIEFKFQSDNNPQEVLSLNGSYAETVPLTALKSPVTALREAFCNCITLDMANIDELAKGHIARLLAACPVRFVKPGSPNQRIRNPYEFDSAGREAVRRAGATNDPEPLATVLFNINQWKFKRNWKTNDPANYFNGIYTYNNDIPTVPTHVPIPPVTANLDQPVDCQVADTPTANAPMPNQAPHCAWTWIYSPNSESVSSRRVRSRSISFLCATSSSPPVQRQEKSSLVTAPSVSPPALTRFGHHLVPPSVPTNFGWTFNPQNEIATFRRLPKSAPSPSPQPPMYNRGLPSQTIAEGTDFPNAAPAYIRPSQSPCHSQIGSRPQPVLRLPKRHCDALKIKMYHLYANILSMTWFYDTFA